MIKKYLQPSFKSFSTSAVLSMVVLLPIVVTAQEDSSPSLYQRLGGYDALVAVTDDIFARLMEDPQLNRFFVGHGTDSKARIKHLFVNRICVSFGGPCFYAGRGLMMTHAGLGITQDDWQSMVKHLNATLDKFKVPGKERQEVLSIVSGFKRDIVER